MGRSLKRISRKAHLARAKFLAQVTQEHYHETLRLNNACSNLEAAVDRKKVEVKVYRRFAQLTLDFMITTLMPSRACKRALYAYLRRTIARPGKTLTNGQLDALISIFGSGNGNGNQLGQPQLEEWFVAVHPNFAEDAPLAPIYDLPPPPDQMLADHMEAAVGHLNHGTKTALDSARSNFEDAIRNAFQHGEGRQLSDDQVREVAAGLLVHNEAYGHIYFGL